MRFNQPSPVRVMSVLATCAGLLLTTSVGRADPAAEATALFQSARDDMKSGNYQAACPKLRASLRLKHASGTLLNLALCEEQAGELASSWAHFLEAAASMSPGDERIPIAKQRAAALEPRLPRLTLLLPPGAPESTRVERDGEAVSKASLGVAIPVNPGKHRIVVIAEDGGRTEAELEISERGAQELTLTLPAPLPKSVEPTPNGAPPAGSSAPGRIPGDTGANEAGPPTLAIVVGGIGVLGVVAGAVTASMAHSKRDQADDHCPNQRCDAEGDSLIEDGKQFATISWISWVVGGVGLIGGTYLWLSHDSSNQIDVAAGPSSASLRYRLRF
ncbi:MAG: hypothetical protein H6718_22800 [Polyangiaceae bacterium]|nr:hypothetical protein [Polyangiaceae bacterium]